MHRAGGLATKSGAEFIISPDTNSDVIRDTNELGLVSIPGVLTASEEMTAHCSGADYVKLFPVAERFVCELKRNGEE